MKYVFPNSNQGNEEKTVLGLLTFSTISLA